MGLQRLKLNKGRITIGKQVKRRMDEKKNKKIRKRLDNQLNKC